MAAFKEVAKPLSIELVSARRYGSLLVAGRVLRGRSVTLQLLDLFVSVSFWPKRFASDLAGITIPLKPINVYRASGCRIVLLLEAKMGISALLDYASRQISWVKPLPNYDASACLWVADSIEKGSGVPIPNILNRQALDRKSVV